MGASNLPYAMKAVILAAGYATRLYPLTIDTPKCLLSVSGRTILDRLCDKLNEITSLDQVLVVSNAKFYDRLRQWQQKAATKAPVSVINDGTRSNDKRLGAIGDLSLGLKTIGIDDDVLMFASDNLFEEDLGGFTRFCSEHRQAVCIAVYDIGDPKLAAGKFGVIETEKDGRVRAIEEKPAQPRSSLIGMGVYYFPKPSLPLVAEYLAGNEAQDAPGHYIRWLAQKTDIYSYLFKGIWYDIGNLEALNEAQKLFSGQ